MNPDDTLPPSSAHDTIPAPPMLEDPTHEPFVIGYPILPRRMSPDDSGVIALDSSALDED